MASMKSELQWNTSVSRQMLLWLGTLAFMLTFAAYADAAGKIGSVKTARISVLKDTPRSELKIKRNTHQLGHKNVIYGGGLAVGKSNPKPAVLPEKALLGARRLSPVIGATGSAGRITAVKIGKDQYLRGAEGGRSGALWKGNKIALGLTPTTVPVSSKRGSLISAQPGKNILPVEQQEKKITAKQRAFYRKVPLDTKVRKALVTSKATSYTVLTKGAIGPKSTAFQRRAWKGKIILPNLAAHAKPVLIGDKDLKWGPGSKGGQWFLQNPDGSFSKQIKDVNGRLAGNITFTRDGSVRIGLDLTGNHEADLYETVFSDGEHSFFASPVGQAALDHFRNGGKSPLCNSGGIGAGLTGGGFAGGMISASDKTAMQVVCGRKEHKPSNGGSAAGGGGGISGDPGGKAMDAMCRKVLRQHSGRPGSPGMVQSNPGGSGDNPQVNRPPRQVGRGDDDPRTFHWGRAIASFFESFIPIPGTVAADSGGNPGATAVNVVGKVVPGVGRAASVSNAVGDALVAGGGHYVNEADKDLRHFEERVDMNTDENMRNSHPDPDVVDTACSAGSSSRYCAAWHREHDGDDAGSADTGDGNASDPGPDQQNDPDAALLSMCQARARSQAMRDAATKDTRYARQLCADPASQPNPAAKVGSATLGDSYGSSITLSTYCGQGGGRGTAVPTPERLASQAGGGRNCGRTESPGADGRCHGVGTQFDGGSAGTVNISYGAVIGFTPFNPAIDPSPVP